MKRSKGSLKRKLSKTRRRIGRWYRKKFATILSVFVTVLCVSLVLLVIYNAFDDVKIDESDPKNDIIVPTTTTTMGMVPTSPLLESLDFNYISFSSINGYIFSSNTERLYEWCGKKEFISLRGDVQITADGELIMYSSEKFAFTEAGELARNINDEGLTYALVRETSSEDWLSYRHEWSGSPLCTFEQYIGTCKKYAKIAYISLENNVQEIAPKILATLEEQEMLGQCIISCNDRKVLQSIHQTNPDIVLSYALAVNDKVTTREIDLAVEAGCNIVNGFNIIGSTECEDVANIVDRDVVAYANERGVRIYEMQVHTMEVANELKKHGIAGVQLMIAPTDT